jgi:hypothetical protein
MKLLLTGSTAAHASARKNANSFTYAGLVNMAVRHAGHDVEWVEPSVHMTEEYVAGFDAVLVGMAPLTSTAAHRIYGALSVIGHANNIGNLCLMVDAPEPKKVWAGLRAICLNPEDLTKDFYSKRKEYRAALDHTTTLRMLAAVQALYENDWPTTIYPKLPWMSFPSVSTYIPKTDSHNLVGINLDKALLKDGPGVYVEKPDYWVTDAAGSKWVEALSKTLGYPVCNMAASRWEDARAVNARIAMSIGCLVGTYKYGDPWWSPAIVQALSEGVPVVTDWRLSSMLGPPWSMLASSVEDMAPDERMWLADEQRDAYATAGLSWTDSVALLCSTIFTERGTR